MNVGNISPWGNCYYKGFGNSVTKEVAVDFLQELYTQLPKDKFLIYGSLAKELLYNKEQDKFGDIDLLASHQMHDSALEELEAALSSLNIKYTKDESEFTVNYKKYPPFTIQVVDRELSKKAYPGGYMKRDQSKFNPEQIEYCNDDLPCVARTFVDISQSSYFFHIDSPKHTGKHVDISVSAFEF